MSDIAKPACTDGHAEWVVDLATKRHVGDLCSSFPEPTRFDPASIYGKVDDPVTGRPELGVLELTPYRIVRTQFPEPLLIWTES